jgi:dehydrogenase/reductase SDR family protein 7
MASQIAAAWLASWSWWKTSCLAAAAAAASGYGWSQLDCSPALYARHRLFSSDSRRERFFRGKVVWILGASSGIGEELAYQLSSSSASLAAAAPPPGQREGAPPPPAVGRLYLSSRSADRLERVAERCRTLIRRRLVQNNDGVLDEDLVSSAVRVVPVDVTDEKSLRRAVRAVSDGETEGGVDIIFLNAGRGHLSPAAAGTSAEATRSVVEQTALWPMVATPLLLPLFGPDKPAHLVVTSSIAALLPVPLSAVYAASKHALRGYFASLQAECPKNLRVDTICPGPVDTDFHREDQRHRTLGASGGPKRTVGRTPAKSADDTPGGTASARDASPLKMPTRRCVELMVSAVAWPSERGRTVYLCPQPALSFLYLYPLLPSFASDRVLRAVGSRRVEMWKAGLDLYDPASWRRRPRNDKK